MTVMLTYDLDGYPAYLMGSEEVVLFRFIVALQRKLPSAHTLRAVRCPMTEDEQRQIFEAADNLLTILYTVSHFETH